MTKYKLFDHSDLKKYKVADRNSKISVADFAKVTETNITDFISCLPNILKGKDFSELIEKTALAFLSKKPIIIGLGGHIIKVGLAPLIIEMMRLGAIQGICVNGSVVIHDFEVASHGCTSEEVAEGIEDGSFGMASDTCDVINEIITAASGEQLGYGEAIGKYLFEKKDLFNPQLSILRSAFEMNIPVTVHIAIGTDIVHQHKTANGKAIGDCSYRDFLILANLVSQLHQGGVFINFGSAVIIPEVFLKALTMCRNKAEVTNFTTAVFDMNYQYRSATNITQRPVQNSGAGYYFVGHHEIMVPLFWAGVRNKLEIRN
ncbi:MAG: hypothetical protein FWG20_05475 [Candidatus Cloacimonetes bacterium]|nr:hypothetical protein [Candidatus Cloacimonadota bacterium]